ncbi:MAG: sulfate/thiosulfate ABC transporter permease CysW, partial [Halomonadaceae bacterium]
MRRIGDAPLIRRLLIGAALVLSALFLLLPLVAIFAQAFSQGVMVFWANVSDTFTLHAIGLTLMIALLTIPVCLVFGVALAWLVTRFSFPG